MSDAADITTLLHRFAWAYDSFDAEACADCFTDDGVFALTGHPANSLVRRGRDEIRAFFAQAIEHRRNLGQQPRHMVSNLIVDQASPQKARARSYSTLALTLPDGSSTIEMVGRNIDVLHKIDGAWKLSRRQLCIDSNLTPTERAASPNPID